MKPFMGIAGYGGGPTSLLTSLPPPEGSLPFTSLSWWASNAVPANNSILGFTVSLGHSTGTNTVSFTYADTPTVVYKDNTTTEFLAAETTGELNIIFGTGSSSVTKANSWAWNGTNDIIVETCMAQNQTNYTARGQMRYVTLTGACKNSRLDSAGDSCGLTPSNTVNQSFATKLIFSDGSSYQPHWGSTLYTSTTGVAPINVYYRRNVTQYILRVNDLLSSFVP